MVYKKALSAYFSQHWEQYYKLDVLIDKGYKRQSCKKCKRNFWAIEDREFCADASCIGYEFIGNPPSNLKLHYVDTWRRIEKYFVNHGHTSIKPFPTVARWRDDLYFTIASINDFQPYVVRGELDPIANPLIVPQPCIRFNDIQNVGITGRHYTNFVMIGQHAFNNEKTGLFYWKNEAIEHDINYLKELGINEKDIVFHEDVWVGGGNFGASLEYFSKGLELGNCVFMQYEELENGETRELKTKVIDMGAGLSRLCWITHGTYTSYEHVLGKPVEYMKNIFNIKVDEKLFADFSKHAGYLDIEDKEEIEKRREEVARLLKIDKNVLFELLEPLQGIYAIADHSLTLLFTITDGMMPSNSGGGYNLRILARRMFALEERYNFSLDYEKILYLHMEHLKGLFDQYRDSITTVAKVIEEEKRKYNETKKKSHNKVLSIIKRSEKKSLSLDDLLLLYKSDGVPPEYIKAIAKNYDINVDIPPNFYELVREADVIKKKEEKINIDVSRYEETRKLYYEYDFLREFKAKVIGIEDKWLILDQTMFYPEGGGQAADKGFINDVRVLDTQKVGNVVLHKVEDISKFFVGMEVIGKVDFERRIKITRHHTATHLITAAARSLFGKHIWQAGAKKEEDKAHIDLTHYKRFSDEEIKEIEKLVNRWVMENKKITIEKLPRNIAEEKYGFTIYQGGAVPGKELRIVVIENIDAEACGGTHHLLKRTGEIGFVKIVKRENIKDGVERLTFKVGEAALDYVHENEAILERLSNVFRVNRQDLVKTGERFFEEWKQAKKALEKMQEAYIKEALKNGKVVELDFEPVSFPLLNESYAILFKENICIIGSKAKDVWLKLNQVFLVKGGGKDKIFTGKIDGKMKEEIKKFLEQELKE